MINWSVLRAIFKRNFVSYFSNPTGYVFICVFVMASSMAAFWPNEFFNANLANLDQLNKWIPYILLVFIPAITMSIWAEERRQGTDELLLTIPATDLDVVLGKYLASLSIFSVALTFSMIFNYGVLRQLGQPDGGLFFGTFVGYWLIGMAMLSIGMVASFLTSNLTVGFILGAIFNIPLVFSPNAEVIIKDPNTAQLFRRWSLSEQFHDFSRGVLSLSGLSFFAMITLVMLYLSVVLIGRRHWRGGRDGSSMLGHYVVRILSLVVIAVGVNMFLSHHDLVRLDVTSEQLSSLSPKTRELIQNLDPKLPIKIEAYLSPNVPTEYVQPRLNLISVLDELNSLGSGKLEVEKHMIETFSEQARLADQKYGIKPQTVFTRKRGARSDEEIFLGVAVTCGLDKVVIPFFDRGMPAEYELVRSICTVAQENRKKIGVVKTDAELFGSFNFQTMGSSSDQMVIDELRKQYEVVEVDPSSPIEKNYDALFAVQPSTLDPQQMKNFIAAVKQGIPTAIFEDPFPVPSFWNNLPGTSQPRRAPQNPMMMMQPPKNLPKGDLEELWRLLGVDLVGDEIIWQNYNPFPKANIISPEWVFVESSGSNPKPFNVDEPIVSNLSRVLFLYPGSVRVLPNSKLDFAYLTETGDHETGTMEVAAIMQLSRGNPHDLAFSRAKTDLHYLTAAHIRGKLPVDTPDQGLIPKRLQEGAGKADQEAGGSEPASPTTTTEPTATADDESPKSEETSGSAKNDLEQLITGGAEPEINVVVVSDIDCLVSAFFSLRAQGEVEGADEIQWDFDNVTFVLNTLDALAGDDRFIEIRKRRRTHRTLENLDDRTEAARTDAAERRDDFQDKFVAARQEEQKKFNERISQIEQRTDIDARDKQIQIEIARRSGQQRLDTRIAQLQQERDREIKKIERDLALNIRRVQDGYKFWAVVLPPILPILVAFFVYFYRRQQEREGISRSRMR